MYWILDVGHCLCSCESDSEPSGFRGSKTYFDELSNS